MARFSGRQSQQTEDNLFPISWLQYANSTDFDENRKRFLLVIPLILAFVFMVGFGTVQLIKGNLILGLFDIGIGLSLGVATVWLRFREDGSAIYSYIASTVAIVCLYSMISGGDHGELIFWMYIVPSLTFFICGRLAGTIICLTAYLATVVILFAPPVMTGAYPYERSTAIRFLVTFAVIIILTYNFEYIQERLQQVLQRESQKLRTSEKKYRHLIDQLQAGVVVHSENGGIVLSNAKARQMLSIDGGRLTPLGDVNQDWELVREDGSTLPPEEFPAAKVIATRQPLRNAVIGIVKPYQGEPLWTLVDAFPVLDTQSNSEQVVVSFIDISARMKTEQEKKGLQEQLQQSQKMEAIGRLAGGVAHDLNNILGAILSSASIIKMEADPEGQSAEDVRTIIAACRRGSQMTRDLLGFARKHKFSKKQLSLNDVVERIRGLLARTIPRTIVIQTKIDDDLALVEGDSHQIENALMNICINAADAMGNKGRLTISTSNVSLQQKLHLTVGGLTPGRYACLTVTDTGTGMDPETRRQAFDPFFTTKPEGKGTGLGLSMVYGIIDSHGGTVTIDSTEGEGTSVTVLLPESDKEAGIRHSTTVVPNIPWANRENQIRGCVLLIDDEPVVLRSTARVLTKMGYTVLEATNGKEAIDIFTEEWERVDAVLMDLIMPEMDGVQAFQAMKAIDPSAKILLCSGYNKNEKIEALLRAGAGGFVQKPFDAQTLYAKLDG